MRDAERSDLVNETESPARVSLFGDMEITECGLVFEEQAWQSGFKFVAGLDEVGRGCLAGPVVAGACITTAVSPAVVGTLIEAKNPLDAGALIGVDNK